ncbi:hypothetical protein [Novosphingobium sp. Leaf2]|uniref:hypothetical protein n=1 Tax=Novosphingobium sp. Leaf2 TaxID=1735670 RepID=UPI0006FAEA1A|nr:hypothetical protein [Novosphingobium sp. Leaf2]KQM21925.1 hypothetical protein ASE49_01015 [Novosphingobium sp. Leaf2]
MMVSTRVQREARDAVIAARFKNGPAPANPYREESRSHIWWNMGRRKAEIAAAELLRVGA